MIRQMMRDLSLAGGLMDNSLVLKKVVKRSPPHRFVAQVGGLAREGGEAVAEGVQWSRARWGTKIWAEAGYRVVGGEVCRREYKVVQVEEVKIVRDNKQVTP